jgi:predicted dienelactone hydrolase
MFGLHAILLLLIITTNAQNFSEPGPFKVGKKSVAAITRLDGQDDFGAFLYYPAAANGPDTPPDLAKAPYPVSVFAHGYLGPPLVYDTLNTHIASWGYVVIATASEVTALVNQTRYVEDILRCAQYVQEQSTEGTFKGMVNDKVGLVGHSMGGGAILRAAKVDPTVKCLVGLAAAANQTTAEGVNTPTRLIVGTNDTVVPSSTAFQQWEGLTGPRQIYEIIGGTHCGFIDLDLDGLPICDKAVMPRSEQRTLQKGLVVAFLNEYLKSNPTNSTSWLDVWGPGAVNVKDSRLRTAIDPRVAMSPSNLSAAGLTSVNYQLTSNRPDPITYNPILPIGLTASSQSISQLTQGTPQNFTISLSPKRLAQRADTQTLVSVLNQLDMGTRAFAIIHNGDVPSGCSQVHVSVILTLVFILL